LARVHGWAVLAGIGLLSAQVSAEEPAKSDGAQPDHPEEEIVWQGRELGWYDYTYTGALVAGAAVEMFVPSAPAGPNAWRGGILFDDGLHDAAALDSAADRDGLGKASDVALGVLMAYPFVVDAGVVAWGFRGSPEVAWNMTVVNLQAFAFTQLVTGVTKRVAQRERPVAATCRDNPEHDESCGEDDLDSFPSGHTSRAFTGAALICTHHVQLGLYGGGAADALPCATGVLAAAFTGFSRIAAERHYVSDVLAGAALGTFSGAVMPWLLYYGFGPVTQVTEHSAILPSVSGDSAGLTWTGTF
jgi:membrane-associated phospholipid phosphatase